MVRCMPCLVISDGFLPYSQFLDVQVGMLGDRLAFLVEWLDPASGITWKYQLLQYPDSCEIEMVGAVFEP